MTIKKSFKSGFCLGNPGGLELMALLPSKDWD